VAIGTQTTSRSSSTSTAADYGFTHEDPGWTSSEVALAISKSFTGASRPIRMVCPSP
jgi:hypothetical protein